MVYSVSCCCHNYPRLAIENIEEPKHLAAFHKHCDVYFTMPESSEDMDAFIAYCSLDGSIVEDALSNGWTRVTNNIEGEILSRFDDGDSYFIDLYLKRFDNFAKVISQEKYSGIVGKFLDLSHGFVTMLWGEIVRLYDRDPNKRELLFRITCGLDTSLRRSSVYVRDWVDASASLLEGYERILSGSRIDSEMWKAVCDDVRRMLTEGIPLDK